MISPHMYPFYRVFDENGDQYCDCSHEEYAIKTLWLHREHQNEIFTYHKINAPILDQTVDVIATREKELPGQQGLPKAKERLPFEPEDKQLEHSILEELI
mgnify:FL=1